MFTKLNKCEFRLKEFKFLSHVISKEGVIVDSSKIEVVVEWQHPPIVYEVRSFMGLIEDSWKDSPNYRVYLQH